jgi:hypothetical protein
MFLVSIWSPLQKRKHKEPRYCKQKLLILEKPFLQKLLLASEEADSKSDVSEIYSEFRHSGEEN